MSLRRSLGWPITLGVVMIVLLVLLTVGWILVTGYSGYWAILGVGTLFLVLVLVGVVFYLVLSIKEINLNQRQSNFIDSVSHELKSPIAALKLYLQTLDRHTMTEQQRSDFYKFMLKDLERLDSLINHMLDAARLDQKPVESEVVDIELSSVLRSCAETACLRYRLPPETIHLEAARTIVRGRPIEVEMVFRNLIDNAIKYSGDVPRVEVHSHANGHNRVVTRIADNGRGIPAPLRRKIFGRFVRLGNELERSQTGTGLGLFIVRTLVLRMRGTINVRSRGVQPGTVFEVELPGREEKSEVGSRKSE